MKVTKAARMKLINNTHFDSGMIEYMLTEAGADIKGGFTVRVEYMTEEHASWVRTQEGDIVQGMYYKFEGAHLVRVCPKARIETLAHELKHVEQALYLGDDFKALTEQELESVGYDVAWYEEEAREFGKRWR